MFTTFSETRFINLLEAPIAIRFSENYAFLDGERPLPKTGTNKFWNWIGIGFIAFGILALPTVVIGLIYDAVSQGRPFQWMQLLILLILPVGLYIAGHLARKDYVRRRYVALAATHIVPGIITSTMRLQKVHYVTFEFSSPIDGKILRGQEPVGILEPVMRVLQPQATIGVLFADATHYTML
ncbi:hypothetical protein [Leptothoe kymatousa]|uniref:Photosystem I assembly protein Ycf4 n=1 Tax=Leptothoe kymatousa TAU-MAC 1615 TaxID=2364775 RepID=A0ABS5Y2A2_9CYAN|nr:hypothetical protein [Leptothoe kymatousa]MBT9311942.1 hypothetical protein [Leptothoe kymatousa TAU-MAC 1615]